MKTSTMKPASEMKMALEMERYLTRLGRFLLVIACVALAMSIAEKVVSGERPATSHPSPAARPGPPIPDHAATPDKTPILPPGAETDLEMPIFPDGFGPLKEIDVKGRRLRVGGQSMALSPEVWFCGNAIASRHPTEGYAPGAFVAWRMDETGRRVARMWLYDEIEHLIRSN